MFLKLKDIYKTCHILFSNSNIQTLGKDINKFCNVNYKMNSFVSKKECLLNLCNPCCKIKNEYGIDYL